MKFHRANSWRVPKEGNVQPVSNVTTVGAARSVALARGLGWFSIALGVTELLAPRVIARLTGVNANQSAIRAAGLRELACGIGLLTAPRQSPYMWARVTGDVLDITMLAVAASTNQRPDKVRVAAVASHLAAVTAIDIYSARALSLGAVNARTSLASTINVLQEYATRHGFPQLPSAMRGAALSDFTMPRDMETPPALQAYGRESSRKKSS